MTARIPRQVRTACRRAARYVRVTVRCPRLVPDIRIERRLGSGPVLYDRHAYQLTFNNAGRVHWIVGGGSPGRVRRQELAPGTVARHRRLREDGLRIDLYRFRGFPDGSYHGGHVGAFIRQRGAIVFASVHGYNHERVAIAIAKSMLPR